jgi:hypothetical protein
VWPNTTPSEMSRNDQTDLGLSHNKSDDPITDDMVTTSVPDHSTVTSLFSVMPEQEASNVSSIQGGKEQAILEWIKGLSGSLPAAATSASSLHVPFIKSGDSSYSQDLQQSELAATQKDLQTVTVEPTGPGSGAGSDTGSVCHDGDYANHDIDR